MTNIVESINSLLRHTHTFSLFDHCFNGLHMVIAIKMVLWKKRIGYCQGWALNSDSTSKSWWTNRVVLHYVRSLSVSIRVRGQNRDNVEIADVRKKKCSCRYFDVQQLPCSHGVVACRHIWLHTIHCAYTPILPTCTS